MYTESRWFAQAVGLLVLQKFSVPSNNSYQTFLMLKRYAWLFVTLLYQWRRISSLAFRGPCIV